MRSTKYYLNIILVAYVLYGLVSNVTFKSYGLDLEDSPNFFRVENLVFIGLIILFLGYTIYKKYGLSALWATGTTINGIIMLLITLGMLLRGGWEVFFVIFGIPLSIFFFALSFRIRRIERLGSTTREKRNVLYIVGLSLAILLFLMITDTMESFYSQLLFLTTPFENLH